MPFDFFRAVHEQSPTLFYVFIAAMLLVAGGTTVIVIKEL